MRRGQALAIDQRAVRAAQIGQQVLAAGAPNLGMTARGTPASKHDTAVAVTSKRKRRVAKRVTFSCLLAAQTDNLCWHDQSPQGWLDAIKTEPLRLYRVSSLSWCDDSIAFLQ
jgi:hypothetical protein